jgi:hypothetical protein
VADLFDMQDEIVARLASQLGSQLIVAEARRAEHVPHPDSMELYFQGMAYLNQGGSVEQIMHGRGFLERALMSDSRNVAALVGIAWAYLVRCGIYLADNRAAVLAEAETNLTKALSLAPDHADGHFCLGSVQAATNRAVQGIAECERAAALDRNLAGAHAGVGVSPIALAVFRLTTRSNFAGSSTGEARCRRKQGPIQFLENNPIQSSLWARFMCPKNKEKLASPSNCKIPSGVQVAPQDIRSHPWSIQEIRRIAQRLARKRIQPADVIAWSLWRRAHQAAAQKSHLKQKSQL